MKNSESIKIKHKNKNPCKCRKITVLQGFVFGRGDGIRTHDLFVPKAKYKPQYLVCIHDFRICLTPI